jgi:hypothetical protein
VIDLTQQGKHFPDGHSVFPFFIFWRNTMTTNANEIRIVIRVEEGLVKDVYSNSLVPIRFIIADYDMADGADDSELVTLTNGDQFVALDDVTSMDDSNYVAEVFAAFDEEIHMVDKQQKDLAMPIALSVMKATTILN